MRITRETTYAEFERSERFITDEARDNLMREAERTYGDMWQLTLGQFFDLCKGNLEAAPFYSRYFDVRKMTVLQVYWCKRFAAFVDEFTKMLERFKAPEDMSEKQASATCPKSTFDEVLLVFARSYFGLHSFAEAADITLGDIIIAKKDAYADAVYRKALQRIQNNQSKNRQKR